MLSFPSLIHLLNASQVLSKCIHFMINPSLALHLPYIHAHTYYSHIKFSPFIVELILC